MQIVIDSAIIDSEIMRCLKEGRPSSGLIRFYSPYVKSLCWKSKEPDDVFQEVFTIMTVEWGNVCSFIMRYIAENKPNKILGGWLKTITSHVKFDFYKRKKNPGGNDMNIDIAPESELYHDDRYFGDADPLILAPSYEQLEERDRTIIRLKHYEGYSHAEIKRYLRLTSEGMSRKLLHNAMMKFYITVIKRCEDFLYLYGTADEAKKNVNLVRDVMSWAKSSIDGLST